MASRRTDVALQAYADHGAIKEAISTDHAIVALVEDYIADYNSEDVSRLALTHRRKDVHAINQAIRAARKANGELSIETLLHTDHGPRAFAKEDRIVFTRNNRDLGVKNGSFGTVEMVGDGQLKVRLDADDGTNRQVVTLNTKIHASYDHGYACTIHKSQGATVDKTYVLGSGTMDAHLTYVALTRHREGMRLFAEPPILQRMGRVRNMEQDGNDFKSSPWRKRSGPSR